MTLETFLLFGPACFALSMAFGPNNLLSVTNGARYGMATAVTAATGRLIAFAIMIFITALGLGVLLTTSEFLFSLLKWIGAAYLIWIGVKLLLSKNSLSIDADSGGQKEPLSKLFRQEFLVASSNPKAILIFTAFFPQFVDQQQYWLSFAILGAAYMVFESISMATYSFAGSRLKTLLKNARAIRWVDRLSGSMMVGFGIALAATQRPT